jgi:histone H3/H4
MVKYTRIVRREERRNKRSGLDRNLVAKILRELGIQRVQEGAVATREVYDLTSNQKRRKRIFFHCCFI